MLALKRESDRWLQIGLMTAIAGPITNITDKLCHRPSKKSFILYSSFDKLKNKNNKFISRNYKLMNLELTEKVCATVIF